MYTNVMKKMKEFYKKVAFLLQLREFFLVSQKPLFQLKVSFLLLPSKRLQELLLMLLLKEKLIILWDLKKTLLLVNLFLLVLVLKNIVQLCQL